MTQVCHVVVDNTHPAKGGQSMGVFILLLVELWHLFLGHMMYVIGNAIREKRLPDCIFKHLHLLLDNVQPSLFTFSLEVTSDQIVYLSRYKKQKTL